MRASTRHACLCVFALTACAGGVAAPVVPTDPAAPAAHSPPRNELVLEASWDMVDRRADPACEKDPRGTVRVDGTTGRLSYARCSGTKTIRDRALDPRELSAVADLASKLVRASSPVTAPPKFGCPRIHWRDASGSYESDPRFCEYGAADEEGGFALRDVIDLLGGLRGDEVCGGPTSLDCPGGASCGMHDGLLPYAFGRCLPELKPGEVTISCLALAYCPKGWREPTEATACEGTAAAHCRFVSAGCGDERLCVKCGPNESCAGGPPVPP